MTFDTFNDKETLLMGELLSGLDNNFEQINISISGMDKTIDNILKNVQTSEVYVYAGKGIVVTASQGDVIEKAVADNNGWALLRLSLYGKWTINAKINDNVKSKIINIDAVRVYYTSLVPIQDMSWADIDLVSKGGMAHNTFNIGDTKNFSINGTEVTAIIIGFYHDVISDSGQKAGITFQLKDCLPQAYPMAQYSNNISLWSDCYVRTDVLPSILRSMPEELRSVIKPVTKYTNNGDAASKVLISTTDSLFLLSPSEVFSTSEYWAVSKMEEGKRYAYYDAGNSRIKTRSGANDDWYLRSPYRVNPEDQYNYFTITSSIGTCSFSNPVLSKGLSFAFCV